MPNQMRAKQSILEFHTWGGARKGAGRKPRGARAGAKHVERPSVDGHAPLHLTMRVARGLPSLRAQRCIKVLREAFRGGRERFGFRLVQYAVQPDHLHLVVEARNKRALSSGAQGLCIRIARRLNRLFHRSGRVFADRYHARPLRTPREVRNALAYVLKTQSYCFTSLQARNDEGQLFGVGCGGGVSARTRLLRDALKHVGVKEFLLADDPGAARDGA